MLLGACGETASISKFTGESHNVAQRVSSFQKNVGAGDHQKLCAEDLSATLRSRLSRFGGCQAVLQNQLHEIDSLEMTIESVTVTGTTATARVKSTYSGKDRIATIQLVKEGPHWRISGASAGASKS